MATWKRPTMEMGTADSLVIPPLPSRLVTDDDLNAFSEAMKRYEVSDTTPPKKSIKDTSQDFYSAGFVAGAIVYFFYDVPKEDNAHSGHSLGDKLMTFKGLHIAPEPTEAVSSKPVPSDPSPPIDAECQRTEKNAVKPKWLKMLW